MPSAPRSPSPTVSQGPIIKPDTLAECHQVIDSLASQLAALAEQVAVLQERVALNSRNSSKPPSSDGPGGSGMNRTQRRASARKRGAQKGHPGAWRELLPPDRVNGVHDCPPPEVCPCGGPVVQRGKPYRHQVFDIPPVQADVQEYRLYSGRCSACRATLRGALPPDVPQGQIGPRALALVGVLGSRYHLTQGKVRDLLAHLLGVDFSIGAISQAYGKVADALKAPVAAAARHIAQSPVVHMDETRYPREGAVNWVWAAVQPQVAVFHILPSRARYVAQSILGDIASPKPAADGPAADGASSAAGPAQPAAPSAPEAPARVVVSDRYAAYAFVDPAQRQVCWAHLIRDFRRISQRPGKAGQTGRRLLAMAHVLFRIRNSINPREVALQPKRYARLQSRMRHWLQRACQLPCASTSATCTNLLKLWPALWTFITHAGVEPTNNDAERAIRPIVLKRKISGLTRSKRGDEFIARAYTVAETCRRQGLDLLAFTHHSVLAWINRTQPPSLVPKVCPSG